MADVEWSTGYISFYPPVADNGLSKHTKFIQSMLCTCTYMYVCIYVCMYLCVCVCVTVTVCQ